MNEVKPMSRLKCPLILDSRDIFYSLVDYRNSRFTSENSDKIIEFYDSFKNRDDLIEWMKERPKDVANIHEVDGDKEIIVVIPTADFNGKYAKECRENIFRGLHMIFVESGGILDPYFNLAHNVNLGVKKAMEYNPKWIVISNDDMYKIDDIDTLNSILLKLDDRKHDVILAALSENISSELSMGRKRLTYHIYRFFKGRPTGKLFKKFSVNYFYIINSVKRSALVFEKIPNSSFPTFGAFVIFSSLYLRTKMGGTPFDEVYINEHEDVDLSLRLFLGRARILRINYRIGSMVGSSLGMSRARYLRHVCGRVYFNFKYEKLLEHLKGNNSM